MVAFGYGIKGAFSMKNSSKQFFLYAVLLMTWCNVNGAWTGPVQVLSGGWGNGDTEFYVDWGDTPAYSTLPILYDVSANAQIVISDESNGRVKVYGADGVLIRNITPPVANPKRSTMEPEFIGQNVVIPIDKYYYYSSAGTLIAQPAGPGKVYFTGERNGNLYVAERPPNERWLVYSSDGTLLNTYTEKPLELGRISKHVFGFQGKKTYRITVAYPDEEWKIISLIGPCGEYAYQQDTIGNLYCVGEKNIKRYSACGKVVSEHTLPDDAESVRDRGPGVEPDITILEGYGNIEMADNGDVYTSKVTPTNFSVIKWTWQASPTDKIGGPDAPTDFAANVLGAQVKLAWRPSLQDPGCVAGYEVSRATVSGGPYTVLTSTAAAAKDYTDITVQSGNTYYYIIRSMSAVANSDYTPEASAVVP